MNLPPITAFIAATTAFFYYESQLPKSSPTSIPPSPSPSTANISSWLQLPSLGKAVLLASVAACGNQVDFLFKSQKGVIMTSAALEEVGEEAERSC